MKVKTKTIGNEIRIGCRSFTKPLVSIIVLLLLICGAIQAQAEWPHVVLSKDGITISYEVYSDGSN
jgi:hypothetical protein